MWRGGDVDDCRCGKSFCRVSWQEMSFLVQSIMLACVVVGVSQNLISSWMKRKWYGYTSFIEHIPTIHTPIDEKTHRQSCEISHEHFLVRTDVQTNFRIFVETTSSFTQTWPTCCQRRDPHLPCRWQASKLHYGRSWFPESTVASAYTLSFVIQSIRAAHRISCRVYSIVLVVDAEED